MSLMNKKSGANLTEIPSHWYRNDRDVIADAHLLWLNEARNSTMFERLTAALRANEEIMIQLNDRMKPGPVIPIDDQGHPL